MTFNRAQAKRRRTHYRAFTAWKAWDQFLKMKKGLRFVTGKIAYHPALLVCILLLFFITLGLELSDTKVYEP